MNQIKNTLAALFVLVSLQSYAQLGFCTGSKGDPIFSENFGNGTTYGPALPAGTTTYPFVTGAPNDGQYTLYYHSNLYTTWHYSLDHTPDVTNGPNGKMLLMNANAVTSGDFYRKTVSGLCVNTTFEFSAWLMNVYNPNTNYCGAGQIPINVRFEIWNADETVLLGSGNTGNITGSPTPVWQQFGLVFTTVSETSVVLKMKNNGLGGCGNDLAIDDIVFSSCGDLTTVSSPSSAGDTYATCDNPASVQLQAATVSASPYFYQWQSSPDGITWTDIPTATNAAYTASNIISQTYFRVKAAQDAANLGNNFCSAISNVFTVSILAAPAAATSNGNQVICSNEAIPALSVSAASGTGVNWYDAPAGGNLLQSGNASFTPSGAGTYYAETFNTSTNCLASPRTPVTLDIIPLPDASITATPSVCSGNQATVSFSGTPNAIVTYTVNGGPNQTITLNASGSASVVTPALTSDVTYALVDVKSPDLNTCSRTKSESVTILVNGSPSASASANPVVCYGSPSTVTFTGTPGATVAYSVNSGPGQTIVLNGTGTASLTQPNVTSAITYALTGVSLPGGCSQALSQTLGIAVAPVPAVAVSASPSAVCANQVSTVHFSGTPGAVVTYTVNAGAPQTIALDASGSANIATPALTGNAIYTLVSAASPVLSSCTVALTGSATIAVNPLPTASITAGAPVCYGNSATVLFAGTPLATITYSAGGVNQSVALDASGQASVTVPNVTSDLVYTLINVTSPGPGGCTQALSQSVTVSAIAALTASVSANPNVICSGQTAMVVFSGTPNAVLTYTVNGGAPQSVTLGATGSYAMPTAGLSAGSTYQLSGVSLSGCSQAVSGSALVSVNAIPDVSYSGNTAYCEGEIVTLDLASAAVGTTFSWTATQNGTTGAFSGSGSQISQAIALSGQAAGSITYTVTPSLNGCTGNPIAINVSIYALPVPNISDGVICTTPSAPPSSQFYTLDTQLDAADHTFQWFFGSNLIPGASSSTYNAAQTGLYTVIATNAAGCASIPVSATVGEMSQGESLEIQQSAAFSDNPRVVVTVNGGDGPFSYQLDDLPSQSSNVFTSVAAGTHTITVTDAFCTHLEAIVTLIDYPKYFTPNGDGFHDTWNITGIDEAVIRIFDRYGKLLKQISPLGPGWDGRYNGHLLPSTDYWFTIDYSEGGKDRTFRAHFSMKR